MTVIVGLETDDGCWMAADRRTVMPSGAFRDNVEKLMMRGGLICGFAGESAARLACQRIVAPREGIDPLWVVRQLRCELQPYADPNTVFFEGLVAHNGKLYHLDTQGSCTHVAPFFAIGSGSEVALGVLWATAKLGGIKPDQRVRLAVVACTEILNSCGGEPQIIHSQKASVA